MPFSIVRDDITTMDVDAIVNAANVKLRAGGGVCGAIYAAAGHADMEAACANLGPIETGDAVITPGFALPAKYVIHTAGPIYDPAEEVKVSAQLRASYRNSLELAAEHGAESIAFPLISAGIYGYPKGEALRLATEEITTFLMSPLPSHEMDVYLVLFDGPPELGRDRVAELHGFIDEHWEKDVPDVQVLNGPPMEVDSAPVLRSAQPDFGIDVDGADTADAAAEVHDFNEILDVPFSTVLTRLIDKKGLEDPTVYKRANIDRRLFSKIRGGKGYMPSKKTVIALAIALELSLEETHTFLECAGFALSRAVLFDVIIEYFITRGNYNIFEINEVLFSYDQQLLGA